MTVEKRNLLLIVIGVLLPLYLWEVLDTNRTQSSRLKAISATANDSRKPLFVLHVGPFETVQREGLWDWDERYFIKMCLVNHRKRKCERSWHQLEEVIQHHFDMNNNVVWSLTSFNDVNQTVLHERLMPILSKWRVRVVMTYRPYYESIVRSYFQNQTMQQVWPTNNQRPVLDFPRYVDHVGAQHFQRTINVKKNWEGLFGKAEIITVNTNDNTALCRLAPELTNICDRVPERMDLLKHHFDVVAVQAYERGLIDKTLSRSNVVRDVEYFFTRVLGQNDTRDFPLICLNETQMDDMLNVTMSLEKELFSKSLPGERARSIPERFEKWTHDGYFCSVNADKLLQNEKWVSFLRGLTGRKHETTPPAPRVTDKNGFPLDYQDLQVNITFLGIGAQGAGTTWLANMLQLSCPILGFAVNKEVHFWDWFRERGLGWYGFQFPTSSHNGELTPNYLSLADSDIREISVLFPNVRIIFLARDLVDRTWSQLRKNFRRHQHRAGKLDGEFVETDNPFSMSDYKLFSKLKGDGYVKRSMYVSHLKRWYKYFPDNHVMIINFEDIKNRPREVLRQVALHLGLGDGDCSFDWSQEEISNSRNEGGPYELSPTLRKMLQDHFRPHANEFNKFLKGLGYNWTLNEYPN